MDNFEEQVKEIATLRETKGREQETLDKLNNLVPQVQNSGDVKLLAKLYWEYHLVWQHIVMNELAKLTPEQNQQNIHTGVDKMMEYAVKAKDVIEQNNIIDMKGGAYRFMGRAATYANNHEQAKLYYETAIISYEGKNLKSTLEVSGFLADSIIRMGNADDGLALAHKVYDDFFNSELGQNLKNEDYFTWAVWMSGIAPRIAKALIETNANFDKEDIKKWLIDTQKELQNPSGNVSWGDGKFQFRIDEINTALQKML